MTKNAIFANQKTNARLVSKIMILKRMENVDLSAMLNIVKYVQLKIFAKNVIIVSLI